MHNSCNEASSVQVLTYVVEQALSAATADFWLADTLHDLVVFAGSLAYFTILPLLGPLAGLAKENAALRTTIQAQSLPRVSQCLLVVMQP